MDKNTIIGLVLIFAIFIAWSIWMSPSKEDVEKQKRIHDSLVMVQMKKDSIAQALEKQKEENKTALPIATQKISSPQQADSLLRIAREKVGQFAGSVIGETKYYTLENDLVKIKISNLGAQPFKVELKNFKTFDSLPLILFDSLQSNFGLNFFAGRRQINTAVLFFEPEPGNESRYHYKVSGDSTISFALRLYADSPDSLSPLNSYIEYKYTLKGNEYMMGFSMSMVNMDKVFDRTTSLFNLNWNMDWLRQEKNRDDERRQSTVYYCYSTDKEVKNLNEAKDDKKIITTSLKWVSLKSKFFLATLIAENAFPNGAEISTYIDPERANEPRYNKSMSVQIPLEYGFSERMDYPMQIYFGPNQYKILHAYNLRLERQIPLGWGFFLMWPVNVYAIIPVFNWLSNYGVNYGIIILILTVLLKIVLFPITFVSYRPTAKMRALKPEIDEINKKYQRKEDAVKKQQATMDLYKKAGVNPMSGCLPMLLQFPILIAMFRFFPSSIELRQQPFLWAHDLSSYDSILDLPFKIPFYGDHVSLFTLLMTIATLFYTKINNDLMNTGQQQIPGMKLMTYLMPILFLGIFNNYSAGLSYYLLVAQLITFGQMFIFRKAINEEKLRARLLANKNKPVKKSNFQKRLEEMARQQQQQARRK